MIKNNKIIIIIVSMVLIVIFVVIIGVMFFGDTSDEQVINNNTPDIVNENINVEIIDLTDNTNKVTEVLVDENLTMVRLANIFTERYGSYTSESEFKNTLELKVYMTDSLEKWVDNYLASQPSQSATEIYYSIVTKVISNKIISQDSDSGKVELITQRVETTGTEEDTYYQNIDIELVSNNDIWLVNKITWGDKQ